MRKHVRIIAVLLSVIFVFCVAAVVATANTDTVNDSTSSGRTFSSGDQLSMTNPLETQPMTYKALISVPADASTRGVIFGNYREADISALNFEITAEGKPSLYFVNSGTDTVTRIEFDYDVRGLGPIDLAVTHTVTESGAEFVCYANGEAVATATSELALTLSLVGAQRQYRFALGHDWYSSSFYSNYYFRGSIQNVALYDRALTADEISSLYSDGVSLTETSLMAYYDLTTPENISGTRVTDSTGNGHDFEPLFQETRRDFEYDYSMAVVGDTQHLIYRDAHHNEDWTSPIYDWLVENKYSKNIKFVMGVGDITNRDGKDDVDDGVDNTDVEWDIAVDQLNKLYTAGIPYSLIVGNHDSVSQLDKYFADNPNFTDADIGYYDGNSLGNYYIKFSVDSEKYMVFGLDYGPNDSKLAWAGDVIASNPDHKVIITTHAYMCADGTTLEATDSTSVPRPAEDASAAEKTKNNGDDIWHELASRYENIILVLSGHISASDIVYRKDYGDNGNTVYQMLMDFQTMDTKYSRTTGMVAMFYFTKDGNIVNVEYISTYRTLEAQANNPEAKDIVFRPALNSFSIEYPTELGVGEECEYGTISPTYADEETYPVLLFKNDKTFIGGFYDLNRALESIVSVYNDKDGSYVIYMRGDTVDTGEVDVVSFGSFGGELLIDLNGTTVTNRRTNYLMNFTFSGDSGKHPKVTIKDGTLVKDGNTLGLIKFDYAASLTKDAYCDITLDNVTLRSLVNYNKNTSVTFVTYEGGWGTATATVNVNAVFNNCTFDFTGSINKAVMIPMRHYYYTDKDQVVMQTTVRGGTAIAETASEFASYISIANGDTNGRADSIKFGRNSDGSYINLVLPASAAAPTASFTGADGESCVFNQISSTDESVTYSLINADALKTKYSTITAEYENAELYPVALFRKDSSAYTFIGAYSNFNSATAALTYNKTYVLLLRNNTTSSSVCKMDSFTGNYTVDLNGYTLTQTAGDLFSINRTNANSNPLTVSKYFTLNFTNGTIINNADRPIVAVNYGSGSKASAQSYSISVNFDDVTFKSTNNDRAIFANWESGYSKANAALKVIVNATFNDCTFDYTGVGSSFVMIDMGDDGKNAAYNRTVYNVTINGGTIISPKAFDKSDFLYMNENTSTTVTGTDGDITINWGDTVTFGKNERGEYITLTLPSTVAAPSAEEIYSNASGVDCIFAKSYESEGKTVYRIRPVATVGIDFTPKMSLTLDRNLILNLYIPVKDFLASFAVGEDSYENFSELKTVTIDDTDYYHIALSLDAKAAAADAVLKAKITVGDKTATATFTFGVVKYAEKLILDGNEIEKALARDVLAYIRAAYTYFGTSDDEKMARITAILGEGYDENNAPVIEGSTSGEASGLASATFVLDGTPAMRFYLPEGANAGKYAFYIGGTRVKTETATDGTYIDIDVYAYALCETVTYTIDGTESGSFHINAYYEWAKAQNDANLVDLVECFWKYLQSARAYRSSILGN